MNATKYARIAEVTGRDGALSVTLAAHQSIGLKVRHRNKSVVKIAWNWMEYTNVTYPITALD